MIEVKNLVKQYGNHAAVDDLSFTVETGKVVGFLGPNGAGKSTLVRCLNFLERPTTGTVFIEGLVFHNQKWFLYYGCADSRVAVAVYDPSKK